MNQNIKICYSAHKDAAAVELPVIASYPEQYNRQDTTQHFAWTNSIADPRNLIMEFNLKRGTEAKPIYAIWERANGRYYAIMTPNNNARGGFDIVTMYFQGCKPRTGKAVYDALKKLLPLYRIQQANVTVAQVDVLLANIETTPIHVSATTPTFQSSYNIYRNDEELVDAFNFIDSQLLSGMKCLYMLDASAVTSEPHTQMRKIERVVTNKTYTVVKPDNSFLYTKKEGEKCEFSYQKPGCDPAPVAFTVGQPTPYATYKGNTIVLKSLAEVANLTFRKHININLVDERGKSVPEFDASITVNGTKLQGHRYDFVEGSALSVPFTVSGCYHLDDAQNGVLQLAQYTNNQTVEFRVVANAAEITLCINGRRESVKVSQALAKSVGNGKYYLNVFGNSWDIEKNAMGPKTGTGGNGEKHEQPKKNSKIFAWVGLGVIILAICGALWWAFIGTGETGGPIADPDTTNVDNGAKEGTPSVSQTDLEKADETYMKAASKVGEKECWIMDSIKSNKYSNIVNLLSTGNTSGLERFAYNTDVDAKDRNGWWNTIMDNIKVAQAQEIIVSGLENGVFHIQDVAEQLKKLSTNKVEEEKKTGDAIKSEKDVKNIDEAAKKKAEAKRKAEEAKRKAEEAKRKAEKNNKNLVIKS